MLSDIFVGKADGIELSDNESNSFVSKIKPIPKTMDVFEDVSSLNESESIKIKEMETRNKIFGTDENGMSMSDKIFGDMGKKSMSDKIFGDMGKKSMFTKNNKMNILMGEKKMKNKNIERVMGSKKKEVTVDEILGKKTDTSMSKKLEMFGISSKNKPTVQKNMISDLVPNFNMKGFNEAMMEIEGRARKHIIKQPEMIANKRLAQQIGLSPMGDFDKDKVMNVLDCNPRNPNEQGLLHRLKNFVGGRGFVENPQVGTSVGRLEEYGQEKRKPFISIEREPREAAQPSVSWSVTPGVPTRTVASRPGAISRAWEATSLPGTKAYKTKQELELSERRARIKALREGGAGILLKEKEMEKMKLEAALRARAITPRQLPRGRVAQGIEGIQRTVGGALGDISAGVRAAMPITEGEKISRLIGWQTGPGFYAMGAPRMGVTGAGFGMAGPVSTGGGFYEMIGQQPPTPEVVSVPVAVPTQPQPMPIPRPSAAGVVPTQPMAPAQQGKVWSAKSKRYVKYTRQPYRRPQQVQPQ